MSEWAELCFLRLLECFFSWAKPSEPLLAENSNASLGLDRDSVIIETVPCHLLLRFKTLVTFFTLYGGDRFVRKCLDHLLILLLRRLFCHLTIFSLQVLPTGNVVQVTHQVFRVVEDIIHVGDNLVLVHVLGLLLG